MKSHFLNLMLIAVTCIAAGSAHAQSIRRQDATLKYTLLNLHGSLKGDEVEGWSFSTYDKKWSKSKSASMSTCYASGLNIYSDFKEIQFRRVTDGADTMMVVSVHHTSGYYEYPEIKEGWTTTTVWDSFIISSVPDFQKLQGHLYALDTTKLTEFSPGVLTIIFPYRASSTVVGEPSEISVNNWLEKAASSYSKHQLGLSVFPVVVDGAKSVRFLIFYTRGYGKGSIEPECFDKGYFEVPLSAFQKMIAMMR